MTTKPILEVSDVQGLARLGKRRSLFLSAGQAYELSFPPDIEEKERERNRRMVATARPRRVRNAMAALCREIFRRDMRLVFCPRTALGPMILAAARDAGALPGSVVVFRSTGVRTPGPAIDFADWTCGMLVQVPGDGQSDRAREARMRALMVQVPGLEAAVFVGGMSEVLDEAAAFAVHQPGRPRYAVGSTGSAAQELLAGDAAGFSGGLDEALLGEETSYSLVMSRLFATLDGLNTAVPEY